MWENPLSREDPVVPEKSEKELVQEQLASLVKLTSKDKHPKMRAINLKLREALELRGTF